ncbi:uncharacterized protein LOC122076249 [Macadamia integrifolia]|uniref:uncharacterized protein LOC122076249 n=1 Tax=Macadamia integrifolia TaxID=60698 RepID=UPI001C4F645C|nr:uncharacterized protein LOC122076249 [Macadamia integrifolia]
MVVDDIRRNKPRTMGELNFDGSLLGNLGHAGAGGIFWDSFGRVLATYKVFLGVTGVFEAEVEGLMEGLMRAKEMNFNQLWVESDSSAVVTSLHQRKIPWFALQRWSTIISHSYREGNSIADYLARDAVNSGVSADNMTLPSHIQDMLARDAEGRPRYRF